MAKYDPKLDMARNPELTKALLLFAHYLLHRNNWRGTLAVPPGSPDAKALVVDAFSKCASGERPYRGKVSLYVHLKGIIRNEIGHLQRKLENKEPHLAITDIAARGAVRAATIANPAWATKEDELVADDWVTRLQAAFANDGTMLRYIALRQTEMFDSGSEYAHELGVTEDDVFNLNRRLKRFLKNSRGKGRKN
jgi:hypothetical protein